MKKIKQTLTFVLFTIQLIVAMPISSFAADPFDSKMKSAEALFEKKEYAKAIPAFDAIYWKSKTYFNEALYYIILSQDALGQHDRVAANLKLINIKALPENEQSKIMEIQNKAK